MATNIISRNNLPTPHANHNYARKDLARRAARGRAWLGCTGWAFSLSVSSAEAEAELRRPLGNEKVASAALRDLANVLALVAATAPALGTAFARTRGLTAEVPTTPKTSSSDEPLLTLAVASDKLPRPGAAVMPIGDGGGSILVFFLFTLTDVAAF